MSDFEVLTRLVSTASCVEDGIVWFIGTYYNALFCLDLKTMECSLFAEFVFEDKVFEYQYFNVCMKYQDRIFVFPCRAKDNIKIINVKNRKMEQIPLKYTSSLGAGITGVYKRGKVLYAVALGLNQILEIDAENMKLFKIFSLEERELDMRGSCCCQGDIIYIFWRCFDKVIEFDMVTGTVKRYRVPGMEQGIYSLGVMGEKLYLASVNKVLFLWDKKRNALAGTIALPKEFGYYLKADSGRYCLDTNYDMGITFVCLTIGDNMWLIPHEGNFIFYVSAKNQLSLEVYDNGENNIVESDFVMSSKTNAIKYYVMYIREDRYIGIFSFLTNFLYEIDAVTSAMKKQPIHMTAETVGIICEQQVFRNFRMSEEKENGDLRTMYIDNLGKYYDAMEHVKKYYVETKKQDTEGKKIVKMMME